jgi:hypothetical protein
MSTGSEAACKLCGLDRPLRDSHIIPEFFYRPGYDDKGRLLALSNERDRPAYVQKGLRERLLCADCEQLLNDRYERPFADLWYRRGTLPERCDEKLLHLTGLDYSSFKLLHLSILWRGSVSHRSEFAQVALGPYENEIRNRLLSCDAGSDTRHQIIGNILLVPETTEVCRSTIMSPISTNRSGPRVYLFTFGGCAWQYVVGPRPLEDFLPYSLRSTGELTLPVLDLRRLRPVDNFFRDSADRAQRSGSLI